MITICVAKAGRTVNGMLTIDDVIERFDGSLAYSTNSKEICQYIADLLKELKERREAPEIVRCGECKHASTDATCCLVCNREGMGLRPYHVHSDDYCSYAERRTDEMQ